MAPFVALSVREGEGDLVDVAPAPVLAGLGRLDDGMTLGVGVGGCVAIRRGVAATDVTAGEADAQVEPAIACAQAVLAALDLVGSLDDDLVRV